MTAETRVGPDGAYELELPASPTEPGFVRVFSDTDTTFVPAMTRVGAPLPSEPVNVLLIPARWTIRHGIYAGTEVEINPADAADGSVLPSYWGFSYPFEQDSLQQVVTDPTHWTAGLGTWPADALPLPVALDRERSDAPLTSGDSVNLWNALDRLEQVLGRDLFREARPEDLPDPDPDRAGLFPGAVAVWSDSTQGPRGRARGLGVSVWIRIDDDEEAGSWSGSDVTRFSVASFDLELGRIVFRSPDVVADEALVMHEAMHLLGVGHGCTWRSVQTFCKSLEAHEPTPEDVAYLEVLEEARRGEKALRTERGIVAAILGQRVVERGESPLPDAEVVDPSVN